MNLTVFARCFAVREVLLDGHHFSVGDCSLVSPQRVGDEPFVCQILALYEDMNQEQFAKIHWFYRPKEVLYTLQQFKRKSSVSLSIDEKVTSERHIYAGHEDTIRLQTLRGTCCVKARGSSMPSIEEYDEDHCLFVSQFFDDRTGKFLPLCVMVCDNAGSTRVSETQEVELTGHFRLCEARSEENSVTPLVSSRSVAKYKLRPSIKKRPAKGNVNNHIRKANHVKRKRHTQKRYRPALDAESEGNSEDEEYVVLDTGSSEENIEDEDYVAKERKYRCISGRTVLRAQKRNFCKLASSHCKSINASSSSFPLRPLPCSKLSNVFQEARSK